jgi:surface protein
MSIRYGQKISNLADKQVSSAFNSFNRNIRPKLPNIGSNAPTYTRPSDYIAIPSISSSEQKVALLISVFDNNSNFLAFTVSGNYTVDWGDGVIENFSAGVAATHVYNYSTFDPTNSTLTSQGFKQALLIITPQAGQNLTSLNFQTRHPSVNVNTHYTQPIVEFYISCPSLTSLTIGTINSTTTVYARLAEYANLINVGNVASLSSCFRTVGIKKCDIGKTSALLTDMSSMFNGCAALQTVTFSSETNTSNLGSMASMFTSCYSLTSVPFFDTTNVTSMASTFNNCWSLTSIPAFNTAKVTNMVSTFNGCYNITSIPLFNTAAVTTMASMFLNCYSLESVPLFNTRAVTDMSSMFQGCVSLANVPMFNTASVTTMANMFNGCASLTTVPLFNTENVTSMASMFQSCGGLTSVPLFNTIKVTTMASMFNLCSSLTDVPLFNTVAVTTMANMFTSCASLKTVPLFNTAAVTTMSQMFQSCSSLVTVPLFNTAAVTTMGAMFRYCYNLQSLPLFNTAANTTIGATFQDCFSLREIPAFNTAAVTTIATAFSGSGIRTIPSFNFSAVTGVNSTVFERCYSLVSVPNISLSGVTDFANMFATCHSLASVGFTGIKYSISFTACNLSKEALETIFTNLGTAQAGATRTLTLTNNWGAPTPVSLTGTPTAGSTTITMANTTGLSAGMQVTGINTSLTTGRAVTFTDAGDLVNLTAHGLSNGDEVSFSVITTTTGIVINTIYFVVNATADNFQLASTLGGSALPLTTNGSGTIIYNSTIVSITPNTSVTMSRPMAGGSAQTLSFRLLGTYKAILKGFTVSG